MKYDPMLPVTKHTSQMEELGYTGLEPVLPNKIEMPENIKNIIIQLNSVNDVSCNYIFNELYLLENLHYPSLMDCLYKLLNNNYYLVRAATVKILQKIPFPKTKEVLKFNLSKENHPFVLEEYIATFCIIYEIESAIQATEIYLKNKGNDVKFVPLIIKELEHINNFPFVLANMNNKEIQKTITLKYNIIFNKDRKGYSYKTFGSYHWKPLEVNISLKDITNLYK